ncbi:hypothetical protein ACMD2_13512 [Ananas comosus]|uniref:Uncharacterized protein n=1 Tax=Ananas comosus TaxID=4615 RepID=A0A199UH09_ANACO|nr:hypothetical protein ACMD2_13512 [Ananas comosus]
MDLLGPINDILVALFLGSIFVLGESSECRRVERQVFSLFRGVIDSVWKDRATDVTAESPADAVANIEGEETNQRASAQNPNVEMAIADESNSLGPTNPSAGQWRKTRKRRSSGTDDSINESFNATLRSIERACLEMLAKSYEQSNPWASIVIARTKRALRAMNNEIHTVIHIKKLRAVQKSLPVVQPPEELLLQRVEGHVQPLEQLGGVLIVHEEPVVEIEAVAAGVLHQLEQHLVPLSVDGGGLEVQFGDHTADGVGEELALGGDLVVLAAGHLDHAAALAGEDVEEVGAAVEAVVGVGEADLVVDEGEAGPAVLGGLGAEHGVGAEDVEVRGEQLEEEVLGELLDGEDVDEEGAAAEALEGEGAEDALGGEDGGGEEDDVRVALAEVVGVAEEGGADRGGGGGVVGAGVRQEGVALPREGAGQELPEVAEPHDGDLQLRLPLQEVGRPRLEVERLGRVHGQHRRRAAAAAAAVGTEEEEGAVRVRVRVRVRVGEERWGSAGEGRGGEHFGKSAASLQGI